MEQVIDKLSGHWPWVKTVLLYIGLSRTLLKPVNLWLLGVFNGFVDFLRGDGYADDSAWVDRLLASRWYRWPAFFVDYVLSVKLPVGKGRLAGTLAPPTANTVGWMVISGLSAGLLLSGCATQAPVYGPVPPASSWTNGVPEGAMIPEVKSANGAGIGGKLLAARERKGAEVKTAEQTPGAQTQPSYKLVWDYDEKELYHIYFDVWRSPDLSQAFVPWATTVAKFVAMPTDGVAGYFKVRAVDTQTGLVSDWGTAN